MSATSLAGVGEKTIYSCTRSILNTRVRGGSDMGSYYTHEVFADHEALLEVLPEDHELKSKPVVALSVTVI